ncbi:GNAT family N-acetyltransferase [Planctomycetes bacterium TBK1r]|uniref:BioF2-like acetyltransferase domain-containing protein n=1 Tax=Stieleria magnilauensis TaxID=2527963 RepID=A0ABX5XVN6_9BACT|nr:hypothetical protein TBK1r_51110 [Planctomycetes bacterium TBK1r]
MITLASSSPTACSQSITPSLRGRFVTDACEMESLVPAWRRLVERCAWRNPCFEPEFLIPLMKHRSDASARLLVVEGTPANGDASEVYGVMPLVTQAFYRLPIHCVHAWRPDEAFESTPLLDRQYANEALAAILTSLSETGARLLAFDTVSAAPEFDQCLRSTAAQNRLSTFSRDRFTRAAVEPDADAEAYLRQCMSKNRRKKAKKLLTKLQGKGDVAFQHSGGANDLHQWAHQFVDLEASGWKGREGTALACQSQSLAFFLEMVDRFGQQDSIRFGRLTLDGASIAMLVDLRSGGHVSGYKTTYDERFAEFSPGFLLELQNVRWLHESGCTVCDSCTDPNNALINSFYAQRLPFQSIVISLEAKMNWAVSTLLPLMQSGARLAKRAIGKARND